MSYKIIDTCNGCGACVRLCPVNAINGEKEAIHVIHEAICIECGACGRICPQMSVQDSFGFACERVRRLEWKKPSINNMLCMSCTICIDACPVGCLAQERAGGNDDPHAHPVLKDGRACIGCGFCAMECPVNAITMVVPVKQQNKQIATGS